MEPIERELHTDIIMFVDFVKRWEIQHKDIFEVRAKLKAVLKVQRIRLLEYYTDMEFDQ